MLKKAKKSTKVAKIDKIKTQKKAERRGKT